MEKQRSKKIQFTSPFLEKTYNLLQNSELEHIISWNDDGTMILINDIKELSKILSKYFKHKKIQSFIRQLNIYDFKKVKKQIAFNAFKHPYFKRNDFSKVHLIKRRVKSNKSERTICQSPQYQSKNSIGNTSQFSQKLSQNESIFPVDEEAQCVLPNYIFQDEVFDYLIHEPIVPVNYGYYDQEDVFA